jgi:hypothetical protein
VIIKPRRESFAREFIANGGIDPERLEKAARRMRLTQADRELVRSQLALLGLLPTDRRIDKGNTV